MNEVEYFPPVYAYYQPVTINKPIEKPSPKYTVSVKGVSYSLAAKTQQDAIEETLNAYWGYDGDFDGTIYRDGVRVADCFFDADGGAYSVDCQ